MPKSKKVAAPKAAKVAAPVAAEVSGTVLKKAFPQFDAEGLKTLRRHLRRTLRASAKEGKPVFRFHKIGTRWVFPSARDVAAARAVAKEVPSLNS